jgi:hypothetical protein
MLQTTNMFHDTPVSDPYSLLNKLDEASSVGVSLKQFRADNVPFNSAEFRRNLEVNGQVITFSGTGAHHQNGVAERSIQTVTCWARAMLLHSVIMWPDQADLSLWPFALQHAVYLWNNLPNDTTNLAPLEIFTGTLFPTTRISAACMCGVVQCMCSILSCRMARKSLNGNLVLAVESFLVFLLRFLRRLDSF